MLINHQRRTDCGHLLLGGVCFSTSKNRLPDLLTCSFMFSGALLVVIGADFQCAVVEKPLLRLGIVQFTNVFADL